MIVWFSGNGNSRLVAHRLGELLGEQIISMTDCRKDSLAGERRVIWVFPVYSWGVPPVVMSFLKTVDLPENGEHYLVLTCGDDIGFTDKQWRHCLQGRGAICKSAFSVIMPNTYVLLPGMDTDSESVVKQKLAAASERLRFVAKAIRSKAAIDADVRRGSCAVLKSKVLYPLFVRFMMSPKPFHATDRCTGCGKCARHCPEKNISMKENNPTWGKNCALCLGCYHVCPHHAVAYGLRTGSKHQYHSPDRLP